MLTSGSRQAVAGRVEPSVVRSDEETGSTVVLGASPVIELFFALCAHTREATVELPWHHAFARELHAGGAALFERFYRRFDGGLLLADLFAVGPHRDLEGFPGWIRSLTQAQFLWLATGRTVPRTAIEDVLAGRLNLRDLHLPPGYRGD